MTTYRNRALLDLAHDAPCCAKFGHMCNDFMGVEPAHSDSHKFGRGIGHKSADWAFAAVCHNAHLDFDKMEREEKFQAWLASFVATQDYFWKADKLRVKK